ncbi:MAG: hypothetical protein B7Y05_01840 [Polynucleobacter sp. 24-46-87]|jgi:hypothetical protein|uniref:DUF1178 family protein n=1 Tax=unclassified Polynucleobacter TaxID=2640945 RepID=UPI000BCDC943|nr:MULTISPECIES: DUF1178 family protein [unclassified Polynucleobacter]OYY20980.1 MAG: hypothetical protein B7Y67_03590 [Polynucleobacter sp. 35-46-11]OZA15946.1 MAG: hypothetical protein B7Y05_01840 [Polynucleobacter sp. 24-46-87]OZA78246.1 MAG: hypothetical protein B7X71_01755 [Polynucleobacter sp. 39-46-10]
MKVYNLACPLDHRFEGWFASEEDCLAQQDKGMLACPICDSTEITRMPSAPHIAKSNTSKALPSSTELTVASPTVTDHAGIGGALSGDVVALTGSDHSQLEAQVQAAFLKGMRELMGRSEDVGNSFAEEARKIHYKESPERSIRGQTTLDEAEALREEGIEVMAMPMLPAFKNTLQ